MAGIGAFNQGSRSVIFDREEGAEEDLRERIMEGGAITLQEADITLLTVRDQSVSRSKVPFVSKGTLDRLFVNILLLFYVE